MRHQILEKLPEGAKAITENPLYFVTADGRVYSTMRGAVKMLRPARAGKTDYRKVKVVIPGHPAGFRLLSVHRLVALAFVPNPLGLPEVNHEDLDKGNNAAGNLTWMTHKGNLAHARAALGNWSPRNHPNQCQRYVAFPAWPLADPFNAGKVLEFTSVKAACAHFGKKYATFAPMVSRAVANEWKALGLWWRRVEEPPANESVD